MSEPLNLTVGGTTLAEFRTDQSVRFCASGKEIGCFDFGQSPATFTGDVDASAQMFVDAVIRMWPKQSSKPTV